MTIGAVDNSSTTVAGQVSDDTDETGRTFVFVPIDLSATSDINDTRFLEHLLDSKQAVKRVNSSVLSVVSNLEQERNKNRNIQNRRMKMAPAKNPTASILSNRFELLTVPIDHAE